MGELLRAITYNKGISVRKPKNSNKSMSTYPSAKDFRGSSEYVDSVFREKQRKERILKYLGVVDVESSKKYIILCIEVARLFHLNQEGAALGRVSSHRQSLRNLSDALDSFANSWEGCDIYLKKKIDIFLKERIRDKEISKRCVDLGGFDPEPEKSWWDRLGQLSRDNLESCLDRDFQASILAFMPDDEDFEFDKIAAEINLLRDALEVMLQKISPKRGRPKKHPASNIIKCLVEMWKTCRTERITVNTENYKIEGELVEFVRYVLGPFMVPGSPFDSKIESAVQQALYGKSSVKFVTATNLADLPDLSDSD